MFSTAAAELENLRAIGFAPDHRPNDDEAFQEQFPTLPPPYDDQFGEDASERTPGDLILPVESNRTVKAVVAHDERRNRLVFQSVNRAKFFNVATGIVALVFRRGQLETLSDPGVNITDHIDAIWEAGRLRFRAYHTAHQVLDISSIFKEATDDDIREIMGHRLIGDRDAAEPIIREGGERIRKKFAILHNDRTLNEIATRLDQVVEAANDFGIELSIEPGPPRRLVLPTDRVKLTDALNFLTGSYYYSPLGNNRQYYSNSHRQVTR